MPKIYCKDCEHFDKCVRGYMPDCPVYYPKKGMMTNEEYIRSCSKEELAKVVFDLTNEDYLWTEEEALAWLKEKHHDK